MSCTVVKILFDMGSNEENTLLYDYKMSVNNWKRYKNKPNTNTLKKKLKIQDIANVKIDISNNLTDEGEGFCVYISSTGVCSASLKEYADSNQVIHVLIKTQKSDLVWISTEGEVLAKVFLNGKKMLIRLIEDLILDMQMYAHYGMDKDFLDIAARREFYKIKVKFAVEKKLAKDSISIGQDVKYVTIASFCRDSEGKIDFDRYVKIWEEFDSVVEKYIGKREGFLVQQGRLSISKDEIGLFRKYHKRGGQLSIKCIRKQLNGLPAGKYILVRTEKKPKKHRQRKKIESNFGMRKWKTGRIKIFPLGNRFVYQKMVPNVSVFEFEWKGDQN